MISGDARRGTALLLAHFEALEPGERRRPGGYERLTRAVGEPLARRLVYALSGAAGTPGGGRLPRG
jgi:hypothetical protein